MQYIIKSSISINCNRFFFNFNICKFLKYNDFIYGSTQHGQRIQCINKKKKTLFDINIQRHILCELCRHIIHTLIQHKTWHENFRNRLTFYSAQNLFAVHSRANLDDSASYGQLNVAATEILSRSMALAQLILSQQAELALISAYNQRALYLMGI